MATITLNISSILTSIKLGYLYNWYTTTDIRNIGNTDWDTPTLLEIEDLRTFIGGLNSGGDMKSTDEIYWYSPNEGATNLRGFSAKGSGSRSFGGNFGGMLISANFWIKDEDLNPVYAMNYNFLYYLDTFTITGTRPKNAGYSIRLVKNTTTLNEGQSGLYVGNDGKVYSTICINGKEWLAENLAETQYRNEDFVDNITDDTLWETSIVGARCAYDNDEKNV